jgi:hypothetical protein
MLGEINLYLTEPVTKVIRKPKGLGLTKKSLEINLTNKVLCGNIVLTIKYW